jgi:hypothetical protein
MFYNVCYMNYLQIDSLYAISLEEIFWGGVLMSVTIATHASGMLMVLRLNHFVRIHIASKKGLLADLFPVILAGWTIMIIHLFEVLIWATFFVWKGAFNTQSVAFYFSLNDYTTLGSAVHLPLHWRLLEGMIAITGLLTFAWSTGVLIFVARQFQEERISWFKKPKMPNDGGSLKETSSG